ncbi:Palmitoyltransferase [Entophlyctis sp. JEL0112]|nr:Palmitoyltransferase [Entophlyctis sp. JEL0112]
MIIDSVVLIILLLTVGILGLWQLYYVASNTTTIESLENEKIEKLLRKGIIYSSCETYPYDLGSWLTNVKTVLGPSVSLWWLPLQGVQGDGISFPINPSVLTGRTVDEIEWPPAQYYDYKAGRIDASRPGTFRPTRTTALADSSEGSEVEDEEDEGSKESEEFYSRTRRKVVRRGSEGYLVRDEAYSQPRAQNTCTSDDGDDDIPLLRLQKKD